MPADEAIAEAFEDLRMHELATISAMQAAVRILLAQFDPEIIEQKAQNREIAAKAPAPPAPTNVVDLVKVLQDSLNRTQSLKQKRTSGPSSGRRSTGALVKQRRTSALG